MPRRTSGSSKSRRRTQPSAVVLLSGGAPNGPLTAGALCAIWEAGKTFNSYYTSGAGATVGLMYAGPKQGTPADAMRKALDFGIDDAIYNLFPVGFRTFFKSGPITEQWIRLAQIAKVTPREGDRARRIYNDLVDFWAAATCPTDVTYFSQGLCAPFPFMSDVVDFDRIGRASGQFYLNAHCIETGQMEEFSKSEIGPMHFNASMSYPFIYSPTKIGDKHYFEGGCVDPLNLSGLHERMIKKNIQADTVVLIDLLGALEKVLVRQPRNLWDAFGISIMLPVVSLAKAHREIYALKHPDVKIESVTFDIPESHWAYATDWSTSNMEALWKIGHDAGLKFVRSRGHLLPDHVPDGPEPV